MCGIAGIFSLNGQPVRDAENRIRRMTSLLKHRGPDSQGIYISPDQCLALGNTRLAIVDPHNPTKQPLETHDRQGVISFNGEVYNYQELMEDLTKKGVAFRSHMDTEVLLEGLHLEGEAFLPKLDGMWVFAYYDIKRKQLLISRDLLGERHLFYFIDKEKNELLFASEVKSILVAAGQDRSFDMDFDSFLTSLQYFAAPPGRTMVKGIQRILPGHNITAQVDGDVKQYRYKKLHPEKWFDFFKQDPPLEKVVDRFEQTFHKVCRNRLPQEVPFVCTLSGGLDSTVICLYASDFGKRKIRTLYGQSYDKPPKRGEDTLDEYEASKFTSGKLNTQHEHIYLNSDEATPILQYLADNAFDGMYDSAVAAFEMLSHHVRRQNTKVMLISEGQDEFLGYPKDLRAYQVDRLRATNPLQYGISRALSSVKPGREMLRRMGLNRFVISPFFSYKPFRFLPINESWSLDEIDPLLTKAQIVSNSVHYGMLDPVYDDLKNQMDYTQLRALSYACSSLPDMYNLRTDKAYMRGSIEARLPYQAVDMVELMLAMPAKFRFNNGTTTKYLMRKIVERHIGPEVAYRNKYGFAAPIWLSPNVFKAMNYEETVRNSSIFKDFPFKPGIREFILKPENKDMLWPFYVLARTNEQLRSRSYE